MVLPDKQAQHSWLHQEDMDGKCVHHIICGVLTLSGSTGSACEQHVPGCGLS